jgi:hypothetical protein
LNNIIENAIYHQHNEVTKWIFANRAEFEEAQELINPIHREYIEDCLDQMAHGIDFAFWFNDRGMIIFEG